MDEGGEGRRRAPEKSVLHEVFRRGWPEVSSLVPQRVKQEVERYLGFSYEHLTGNLDRTLLCFGAVQDDRVIAVWSRDLY